MKWIWVLMASLFVALSCGENQENNGDAGEHADTDTSVDAGAVDGGEQELVSLPVTPEVFVDGSFFVSEGICFNDDGRMFVVADFGVHEIQADGTPTSLAKLINPIGLSHDGDGNLLVADFGPTSAFVQPPSDKNDGTIVKVTPDGNTETLATGIPDPNFIAVRDDGSFLVSDDGAHFIYEVEKGGGEASIWSDEIVAPNGIAFSSDGRTAYVCQTFEEAGTLLMDNRIWSVGIGENAEAGDVDLLATVEDGSALDGIALDAKGRIYVAANVKGKIWRIDPETRDVVLIASGMKGVASLAFGRGGDFPETSLYATGLFGGKIWRLDLGVPGASIP